MTLACETGIPEVIAKRPETPAQIMLLLSRREAHTTADHVNVPLRFRKVEQWSDSITDS